MVDVSPNQRGLLDVINECDNFPSPQIHDAPTHEPQLSSLWLFFLPDDPRPHGFLLDSTVQKMPWTPSFRLLHHPRKEVHLLRPAADDWQAQCSAALDELLDLARLHNTFPRLGSKRDEKFPILGANFDIGIERSASSLFGIVGRGAHMTAYVRAAAGWKFWIPQRNLGKATYGGMFDNAVAGGVALGEMPFECLVREAEEEAGMADAMVRGGAHAAGTVTYLNVSDERAGGELGLMNPVLLYVYDLEVGEDVVFKPVDDDVHAFHLMTLEQVMEEMKLSTFKPGSALVMLDFLVRHGMVTAENETDYVEIVSRLHRRLPFPTTRSIS